METVFYTMSVYFLAAKVTKTRYTLTGALTDTLAGIVASNEGYFKHFLTRRYNMSEFDKVIGYEDAKMELMRFCDVLRNPEKYTKLGVTMPSGILLCGEPGLGKTLMARCFIAESGCRVFTLRKEKPNGDFVNQIKETFEKSKKDSPAIVFLDDMDKFANEDYRHRNAEEYVTVQSCIDDCKGEGVFTLATVNDKYCLPDSLWRAGRFDKVIEVNPPKGKDAIQIIEHFLNQKQGIGDVDIEEISRLMEGHSCAELETVINEAGIYAGFDNRTRINQHDIVKACMRMMFDSPECVHGEETELTKKIAIHEAGHAVVAEVLEPGSVSLVSVCRYSGAVEGITKIQKSEGYSLSKELQEHAVMHGLGGKAATEVVYGEADMGCNADLHKVFDMVEEFVDNSCTYGFETFETCSSSQFLLEKKDRLVASEVDRLYKQAKKIIVENRTFLDAVVSALIEKETITYRDLQEIRKELRSVA